jgi:hypothetical protein
MIEAKEITFRFRFCYFVLFHLLHRACLKKKKMYYPAILLLLHVSDLKLRPESVNVVAVICPY